ncbi:MAG: histidinol dehydrogenase, partial [Phycisphaeraceae bacterium]|nr:histidinol dehydrogenase [Phycisphaeraceae bacterium]
MTMRSITLAELDQADYRALVRRSAVPDPAIRVAAAAIVDRIRLGGDAALLAANSKYGGGPAIDSLRVPSEAIEAAFGAVGPAVREALKAATKNIRNVHERQRPADDRVEVVPGVVVERRWSPVSRAGVYVPGGRAA